MRTSEYKHTFVHLQENSNPYPGVTTIHRVWGMQTRYSTPSTSQPDSFIYFCLRVYILSSLVSSIADVLTEWLFLHIHLMSPTCPLPLSLLILSVCVWWGEECLCYWSYHLHVHKWLLNTGKCRLVTGAYSLFAPLTIQNNVWSLKSRLVHLQSISKGHNRDTKSVRVFDRQGDREKHRASLFQHHGERYRQRLDESAPWTAYKERRRLRVH